MDKYIEDSKSARLLYATIRVYDGSILKKIFSAIGNIFRKYFNGSIISKIFTIFDFDTKQYENSLAVKTVKRILRPFISVANKVAGKLAVSEKDSALVKLVSSRAGMAIIIFNGSIVGKMINHYLESEN